MADTFPGTFLFTSVKCLLQCQDLRQDWLKMSNYGHHFFFYFYCGFDKLNKPVGYVNITLRKTRGIPQILLFLGICGKIMEIQYEFLENQY